MALGVISNCTSTLSNRGNGAPRRVDSDQHGGDDGAHPEGSGQPRMGGSAHSAYGFCRRGPCGEGTSQEGFPCANNPPERWSEPLPGVVYYVLWPSIFSRVVYEV